MARKFLAALLLALFVVGAAQLACSDDDAFPIDILIIVSKMSAGLPPSDVEQKRLEQYALRHRDEPVNGITFGYVMAVIHTCTETGQKPPSAEIAKMRQWASGMQARKQEMIKDVQKMKAALEGAIGSKTSTSSAKYDPHSGTVEIRGHEHATMNSPTLDSSFTTDFDGTFPVRFDVKDENGNLTITWSCDPMQKKNVMGNFSQQVSSNMHTDTSRRNSNASGSCAINVPAVPPSGMIAGSVAVLKAGARPYFKGAASTNAPCKLTGNEHLYVKNGQGNGQDTNTDNAVNTATAAFPPTPASLDDLVALDSPFLIPKGIPEQYRQMVLDKMKASMDPALVDAVKGASCTFDADSFRHQWAAGKPFSVPLIYTYTLRKTKNGETTVADFSTTVTLTFGTPPAGNLEIVPGPAWVETVADAGTVDADTYHKWVPKPYVDDEKVTKAFGIQKNDGAVTLSFVVRFHADAGADLPTGTFQIQLTGVSDNKGVCINYPPNAASQKGLFFPTGKTGDGKPIQPDEKKLTIASSGLLATTVEGKQFSAVTITVAARDAGAYGLLEATCPEKNLHAVFRLTGKEGASIPEDTDQNCVADQWEKDNNIFDKKLNQTWDEEEKPSGPKGDGLTLYDEYRGIICEDPASASHDLKYFRLDPTVKKLLVYLDKTEPRPWPTPIPWEDIVRGAVGMYANATKVKTYIVSDKDYVQLNGDTKPPVVNFNSVQTPACAVRITRTADPLKTENDDGTTKPAYDWAKGRTPAVSGTDHVPTDPHDTQAVFISLPNISARFDFWATWYTKANIFKTLPPGQTNNRGNNLAMPWTSDWFTVNNVDFDALQAQMARNRNSLFVGFTRFVIMHEMGHATGAGHHDPDVFKGERSCPMRYWDSVRPISDVSFFTLTWQLDKSALSWSTPYPDSPYPPPSEYPSALSFPAWAFCSEHQNFPSIKPK